MVTITCNESGIQFEAATRRTKQHPLIAELKAEANKNRTYREAGDALREVRKAGGYETIEEFMALVRAHMSAEHDRQREASRKRAEAAREAEAQAQARRDARTRQNDHLKAHGYRWSLDTVEFGDGEDDDVKEWFLRAEDGRVVTVDQALAEIERGVDVVNAEREAEAQARREAEAQAQAAKVEQDKKDAQAYAEFDAEADAIRNKYQRVERFRHDWDSTETIYKMASVASTYRRYDYIFKFDHNGHQIFCVVAGSGIVDDGYTEYYTSDPAAAGLTAYVEPDDDTPSFF